MYLKKVRVCFLYSSGDLTWIPWYWGKFPYRKKGVEILGLCDKGQNGRTNPKFPLGSFKSVYLWRVKFKISNMWWTKVNGAITREKSKWQWQKWKKHTLNIIYETLTHGLQRKLRDVCFGLPFVWIKYWLALSIIGEIKWINLIGCFFLVIAGETGHLRVSCVF